MIEKISLVIIAYLMGSIPFAYIIARWIKGIDIRECGSRNVGGHNVRKQIGDLPGIIVGLADLAKGTIAVLLAKKFGGANYIIVLAGIAVIVGHNWPIFLQFRGGKGAATSLGVLAALMPKETVIVLIVWIIIGLISQRIGLTHPVYIGGIVAGLLLPFLGWYFNEPKFLIILVIAGVILLTVRHLPALKKLLTLNR